MNFLLIDDDRDEFDIILAAGESTATSENYTWSYAPSAAAGIEVIDKLKPAAIFIDYNMPVMNGIDCAAQIRNDPRFASTCIILYSTSITSKMAAEAETAGVNFSIQKPDDFSDMRSFLDRVKSFVQDSQ